MIGMIHTYIPVLAGRYLHIVVWGMPGYVVFGCRQLLSVSLVFQLGSGLHLDLGGTCRGSGLEHC